MAKNNVDQWLTKSEAVAVTGLSMRAIERLIEDGTIAREYRKQPGKRSVAVLNPGAIEKLHRAATPITPAVLPAIADTVGTNGVPALQNDPVSRAVASFLSVALPHVTQQQKRFLTLPEAAAYVGLPESYIRTSIRKKKLTAIVAGKARETFVRRSDLDQL